ncbi:hypothetical protein TNCV_1531791 [Trichonephila clavipes]|nr:hypothetical protein TNCV_1531791 [Trichonephila clavipes]
MSRDLNLIGHVWVIHGRSIAARRQAPAPTAIDKFKSNAARVDVVTTGVDKDPGKYDEAHFWLNGYVNKQNCRIWSEANPQVYVETPLHPEKLTVWCALWAGGILLQKR